MNKSRSISVVIHTLILTALTITIIFFSGCQKKSGDQAIVKTMVNVVIETVIETIEIEVKSPYTYENLRKMTALGIYEGNPAAAHTMAFANISRDLPYGRLVEESIIEEWELAGGSMDDLNIFNNDTDPESAIKNAEIIFADRPEVLLEFQIDPVANERIGMKAEKAGVFIIAVENPVPGFPLMGVDNYGSSALIGEWAARQLEVIYGGWEKVDRIFFLLDSGIGDVPAMRIYGSIEVFKEWFGSRADPELSGTKAVLVDTGITTDEAEAAMLDMLNDFPEDRNIMIFCMNDQVAAGVKSAADLAGRWEPGDWMIMSHGLDDLGKQLIREDIIDGSSAFFPEEYGQYLIPAALAHIYDNRIPANIFIENKVITKHNIADYYP